MKKKSTAQEQFEKMILTLPNQFGNHAPGTSVYGRWKNQAKRQANELFSATAEKKIKVAPFGEIVFPFRKMGAVSSLNLFEIDEMILFSFYWQNRNLYKKVADIGANIGLHSIILGKCGYTVKSYEPDPEHYKVLSKNLTMNGVKKVKAIKAAVSDDERKSMEFVRVLGNTTSNFLIGSKDNAYGELETIKVRTVAITSIMKWADLIKLDAEGHEGDIILATKHSDWENTDMVLEIGGKDNAKNIFKHLKKEGVNIFTQKNNWERAKKISDIPTSYHEGLAFISCRKKMPWSGII